MSDMLTTLRTSAHDLRGVPDGSVQAVITSPPYYGLRSYAGDQDVEWPTVTYRLNEWCEPVTVQGCEPGCEHEWGDELPNPKYDKRTPEQLQSTSTLGQDGSKNTPVNSAFSAVDRKTATQGRYCLRCGGWRGPLGLEPSPVAYIGHLILCLREWKRVLRDDGTCWVNLGDTYAANRGYQVPDSKHVDVGNNAPAKVPAGLKAKDLLMIPAMFAFAARADGWYLRSDIIWHKPNPMPESVTDRPTKAHEYVFLLAKSPRYYWDADAVRESASMDSGFAKQRLNGNHHERKLKSGQAQDASSGSQIDTWTDNGGRNIRTVWTIATSPYPGAHYAVFPERLVEPMVKAATSERGCCPNCGAPWRRVVERSNGTRTIGDPRQFKSHPVPGDDREYGGNRRAGDPQSTTLGWQTTCACYEPGIVESTDLVSEWGDPIPCTVLDPFAGSGTTGRVAVRLGRRAILCDVSDEYLDNHVPERTTVQMELVA